MSSKTITPRTASQVLTRVVPGSVCWQIRGQLLIWLLHQCPDYVRQYSAFLREQNILSLLLSLMDTLLGSMLYWAEAVAAAASATKAFLRVTILKIEVMSLLWAKVKGILRTNV